ncbi:G-alpha-domain-containing protein [Schizopora paradoxa]|uniref:G-alpha-domain-containing protein n=1 Tax=Schizopora paradoxa TaxID=27342 RepID=A0A0H2SAL7_9AGAM|nr:G-alpha-domain-containing protein [Schizopora paradoxa]
MRRKLVSSPTTTYSSFTSLNSTNFQPALNPNDPFYHFLAPPADETPEQRFAREQSESDARQMSEEIDENLRAEKAVRRRRRKPVKVLLLGQSESGKSTTLKNFQLTYAPKAWEETRSSWRSVVQLNLCRTANAILDLLGEEMKLQSSALSSSPSLRLSDAHRVLCLRLAPLRHVQRALEARLGPGVDEASPSPIGSPVGTSSSVASSSRLDPQEFFVRSNSGWKAAFERLRGEHVRTAMAGGVQTDDEESTRVIAGRREELGQLWRDDAVQEMLERRGRGRGLRLEDGGGFFLDDIDRIAVPDYVPSDDDIVRARLRTMGVQEHRFVFERGSEQGQEWLMYDVGGTRSHRAAWAPFFDDTNAILFLAPISCFDEALAEDSRVNRLEDSFLLWKAVCANKLLARTMLVLFLNKCDLLERKLAMGNVEFRRYVPSYGTERKNDAESVTKYLKQKFRDMSKQYSPEPRGFYVHLTSVIDTKATAITLGAVREGILRDHLRGADFL